MPPSRSSPPLPALAGTNDPKKVAAVLGSGRTFPTIIGDVAFDPKTATGTDFDYAIYAWTKGADGQFSYVQQ